MFRCRWSSFPVTHVRKCRLHVASSEDVLLTEVGSCGIITLNRPKVLNSLDLSMIRKIYPRLKKWNEGQAVNLVLWFILQISHVIIEGTGSRAFCAGGDVRAVADAAKRGDMLSQSFVREEYQLNYLIGTLYKPMVALLNGITMGGGVGLTVHGKYRVATENTIFAMPETALGLFPDVGGGYFLPRLPLRGLGSFLALTGHRLKGEDVVWAGVATHYLHSGELPALKEALCKTRPVLTGGGTNQQTIDGAISDVLRVAQINPSPPLSLAPHVDAIGRIFALFESGVPVTIEKIIEKLEAYGDASPQNKDWSEQVMKALTKASPISLKVTLRQQQEGSKLSFADNFKMEFRLSQHFVRGHDFPEGVRAILIDKDNQPRWKPEKLSEVTTDMVDQYFTMLPGISEWNP